MRAIAGHITLWLGYFYVGTHFKFEILDSVALHSESFGKNSEHISPRFSSHHPLVYAPLNLSNRLRQLLYAQPVPLVCMLSQFTVGDNTYQLRMIPPPFDAN